MACKHKLRIDEKQYKNQTIYRMTCTECGLRTVWAESPELARNLFWANDDILQIKERSGNNEQKLNSRNS